MKIDRSILQANNQEIGEFGDPNKLENSIEHLANVIDTNDNDTSALKTDNTTNKGNITNLLTDVSSLKTDNTSNKTRLTALENDNTSNKSRIGTLETDNASNKSRITANENNIAYDEARLDNLLRNTQQASEVVDARTKADGTSFPLLGDRLNDVDSSLVERAIKQKGRVSVTEYDNLIPNKQDPEDNWDWTEAIKAALAATKRVLDFPDNGYRYNTRKISITDTMSKRLTILGNGSQINGLEETIFSVETNLKKLKAFDFEVDFSGTAGLHRKEFFSNGATDKSVEYDIDLLEIKRNDLGFARVCVYGVNTVFDIKENTWEHDNTVTTDVSYLHVDKGDPLGAKNTNGWIKDNRFVVYPPTGENVDIIKISGGIQSAVIDGNYVENKNLSAGAQVDVYTGGHKMRFVDNTLINTQLHRKQVKGSLIGVPEISYDVIQGNSVEFQDGSVNYLGYYLIGSFMTVANNQFISKNMSQAQTAFALYNSDINYDSLNTIRPSAIVLSGNMADLRNAHASSVFMDMSSEASSLSNFASVLGNVLLGGYKFLNSSPKNSTFLGNIWGVNSSSAINSFVSGVLGSVISLGNMTDGTADVFYNTITQGNVGNESLVTVNSSTTPTPSVKGLTTFIVDNGGTITDFLDGVKGQRITLIAKGAGATIKWGTPIILNGSADFVMTLRSTLTLIRNQEGKWIEISRSKP